MNICQHCNESFYGRPERPNKYCSHECHVAHEKTKVNKICGVCNTPFVGYASRQFCSLKCVHASMRQPERPCAGCGKPFAPEKVKTLFCSKDCEIKSHRQAPEPPPIKDARWVPLTKNKFALVDSEDFERVSQYSWYAHESHGTYYARSWTAKSDGRKSLRLHHFVLGIEPGSGAKIDHKNQHGWDCRKDNLRPATESQNRMNTIKKSGRTPYKGVAVLPNGKFKAAICANGHFKYLGSFIEAEDAARAYDTEARKLHGERGRYNFPESGEMPARP